MKRIAVTVVALFATMSTSVFAGDNAVEVSGWGERSAVSIADSKEGNLALKPGSTEESVVPADGLQDERSVSVTEPVEGMIVEAVEAAEIGNDFAVKNTLKKIIPGQTPDIIEETPYKGLYEVVYGSDIFYLSEDGRYLIQGDMVDLATQENLTEGRRTKGRLQLMATADPASKIRFIPEDKIEHVVDVFTDVDCFYCQKLHHEMADYLREGIEIRYLAFPRAGVGSHSYEKIVSVWCADDQPGEMTLAKNKQQPEKRECDNPVVEHMELGRQVGVSGTPALVFEDGTLMPGYVPAVQLKKMLDEKMDK